MKHVLVMSLLIWIMFYSIGDCSELRAMPDQILVLNSYDYTYAWANEEMNGVKDTVKSNIEDVTLRIEYMDTKRIKSDAYYEGYRDFLSLKYGNEEIDAVICCDDNALAFMLRYREALFPDIPIFFCGINLVDSHHIESSKKVYGIAEKMTALETVEVAFDYFPSLDTVYVVLDNTPSGQATHTDIIRDLAKSEHAFEMIFLDDYGFDDVLEIISEVNKNAIVLYGFYVVDPDGTVYDVADTTRRVSEASAVPVFGLVNFSLNHGIVGGKLLTGYEQGQRAAQIMLDYFEGKMLGLEHYIEYSKENVHIYDYQEMMKRDMKTDKLPAESIILNRPISFYEQHGNVILTSLMVISILLIHITILRIRVNNRTRDLRKSLADLKKAQDKLVQSEKLASLGGLVSGVAHEINTPLGNAISITSYFKKVHQEFIGKYQSGDLKKSDIIEFNDEMEALSSSLETNLQNGAHIVNAFKSVAQGQNADMSECFNLKAYLSNIAITFKHLLDIDNHSISIKCSELIEVCGKQSNYYLIFENLIKNSVEHGFRDQSNGMIEMEIKDEKDSVLITYRDNGTGVEKELYDKIFEPFYTDKRGKGHSGLGLYIVYNAVQSMEGQISTCEGMNHGLGFMIKIPQNY